MYITKIVTSAIKGQNSVLFERTRLVGRGQPGRTEECGPGKEMA